jgi:hypothetical protein
MHFMEPDISLTSSQKLATKLVPKPNDQSSPSDLTVLMPILLSLSHLGVGAQTGVFH